MTTIINKKIADLKPYSQNAKLHPIAQVQKIAQSIKQFGFLVPIVIDENNEIIAGHGRMMAAQALALQEVPCVVASGLSEEEVKAYRLADNKLNESDWNYKLVMEELMTISEPLIEITGFNKDLLIDADNFGETFSLKNDGRSKIQQMTFTCSGEQVEQINEALSQIKNTDEYKNGDFFGNENTNGNALYTLAILWQMLKK